MKLKIANKPQTIESEKEIILDLYYHKDAIRLRVIDEFGCPHSVLLEITKDGELVLFNGISNKFGFVLDSDNSLKVHR